MKSRSRAFLLNLVLAVVVFVIGAGVIEVVLRTTNLFGARLSWSQPDDEIRWRFSAGRRYWYNQENDHPIEGRINSHGWRDVERSIEKPTGGFRVAVVGDSYVSAFEVELDSTMCAIAERRLSSAMPGRRVEVLNFGRNGMSPTEELIVLEREVLRFDPDVVVILFAPINDIGDVQPATAVPALRPFYVEDDGGGLVLDTSFRESRGYKGRKLINTIKQHSAIVSLASERYNALRFQRRQDRVGANAAVVEGSTRMSRHLTLCTDSPDPTYARGYDLCKRLIAKTAETCRARGVDFVMVAINNVYLDEKLSALESVDPTFDPFFFDRDLGAMADSLSIGFVGLQTAFDAHYRATGERLHWNHWNYGGHRVAARELARCIEERFAR
jgi:hypothetical protein